MEDRKMILNALLVQIFMIDFQIDYKVQYSVDFSTYPNRIINLLKCVFALSANVSSQLHAHAQAHIAYTFIIRNESHLFQLNFIIIDHKLHAPNGCMYLRVYFE